MRFSNLLRDEPGWQTGSVTTHYADDHLAVETETVQTPHGSKPRSWTVVRRKAAVVIAGETAEGTFVLVREERIPVRATIWSMPAGQIDDNACPSPDEIEKVALRELHEETGHDLDGGGELIPLGYFFTSPGLTDEHCYLFLARPVLKSAEHHREEGEGIVECRAFSPRQITEMIDRGEIRDANTLSICARMAARGLFAIGPIR